MNAPARTDAGAALARVGRHAWALLGLAGVVVLIYLLLREISVVATPLAVALFPAAVLWPLAHWLRGRGINRTLVALLLMVVVFGFVGLALWFIVPRFIDQVPDLADNVEEALADLENWLAVAPVNLPFDIGAGGLEGLASQAFGVDGDGGNAIDQGLNLARRVTEFATSTLLFLIALFFYLRDGERIWAGITRLLPERARWHAHRVGGQLGWTLGAYFRGQMLIALVDAVAIGLGLAIIGVPLVLPLALLIFLGSFFPIVGAFVSGMVAVLVALADQGLGKALLALLVVVIVQQTEGNLLEPLILSPALKLHPFVIILAVTIGALTYGVLGAFLAVPITACLARIVDYVRGRPPAAGPRFGRRSGRRVWGKPPPAEPSEPSEASQPPVSSGEREPESGRGAARP